jgi:hypothetical protein
MMFRRLFAWMQRYERHLSAAATIIGAVVDQIFFARVDLVRTHYAFLTYVAVCFVSIPVLHWIEARAERGHPRPRFRAIFPIATQFALGGFWSGFIVFYGRSAVVSASWPFLLVLAAMFLGNELLKRYHERLVFTSVLFFFALYSYAIFAVPLLTGSIGMWTFLLSGAAAIAVFWVFVLLLRSLGRERFRGDVWRIRAGAFAVLALINLFYFTNVLPPLPLSAKAAGVYHSVWRVPGDYLATAETNRSLLVRYLGFAPTLHMVGGESAYAYSSVFAPTKLSATVVHRWQWYDPAAKKWVTKAAISYPIAGGRDGGYRGYSAVLMNLAGKWRVNVETVDGRLIARLPFEVEIVQLPPPEETVDLD